MEISEFIATTEAIHREARRRGLYFQTAQDEAIRGRTVRLNGGELTTFGSCSYLGLEHHPALVEGVIDAVRRYGTQFSYSRAYLSSPQYDEAEELLSEILGAPTIIALSTALGHQAVLPTIAGERDAIVLDGQVHASVQKAATLAQANGTHVEIVRHFELDARAEEVVARLARTKRTVYVAIDGVYSMYGDCAPLALMQRLLALAPNVRIYVDDAHGLSWTGRHGRGWFLREMPLETWGPRVVYSSGMAKAFSAGGGLFAFADPAERDRVRLCGGSLTFSGPVQPPMLGAVVASAKLHLSPEIEVLQARYRERNALMNALMAEHDVPLLCRNESPIFFVRMGKVEAAHTLAERLLAEGYYVNTSTFPMVPLKRAGMRITVSAAHTEAQIRGFCEALAHHLPKVLDEFGISREELDALFEAAIPAEAWGGIDLKPTSRAVPARGATLARDSDRRADAGTPAASGIYVTEFDALTAVTAAIGSAGWDTLMSGCGTSSVASLAMGERVFDAAAHPSEPEHAWTRRYFVAFAPDGTPVGATYGTRTRVKDDMFMRAEVSEAIERIRQADDRYYLTTDAFVMGSPISEGAHVGYAPHLDAADRAMVWASLREAFSAYGTTCGAALMVLRDFGGDDEASDSVLHAEDWIKSPLPDSHRLELVPGESEDAMVTRLTTRSRSRPRARRFWRGLRETSAHYTARIHGVHAEPGTAPLDPAERAHCYALYRSVADRKFRINGFPLPPALLDAMLASPSWEILTVHRDPAVGGRADGRAVAWGAMHRQGAHYMPFLCGFDIAHVRGEEFGAYRQLLLAVVRRAGAIGAQTVHLGWDAETEKARLGATAHPACCYMRHVVHDYGEELQRLVTHLGLSATPETAAVPMPAWREPVVSGSGMCAAPELV